MLQGLPHRSVEGNLVGVDALLKRTAEISQPPSHWYARVVCMLLHYHQHLAIGP